MNAEPNFRPGDWVRVRSLSDIQRTLDANGTCDGLPFMPEMIGACGATFQLSTLALKSCVEVIEGHKFIDVREFPHRDTWVLDDVRCSGAAHDGCQRACLVLWKSAWLERVDSKGLPST